MLRQRQPPDRLRTWHDWFANNGRSMRNRPWMPAAGNHENELGNGPIGYAAYQAYFRGVLPGVLLGVLPASAQRARPVGAGLWYAYTVGSVRFVHLDNDDVCYQDGGNSYVRGYSGGAQRRWLERELAEARGRREVDWVVVCMHQGPGRCPWSSAAGAPRPGPTRPCTTRPGAR